MEDKVSKLFSLVAVMSLFLIGAGCAETPTTTELAPSITASTSPVAAELPQQKIERTVREVLAGDNNFKKQKLRTVDVKETKEGLNVAVEFNASDNLNADMILGVIKDTMADVYYRVYNENKNVQLVTIGAFFPLKDKYGNDKDTLVFGTSLAKSEADKINWSSKEDELKNRIIPSVWTESQMR